MSGSFKETVRRLSYSPLVRRSYFRLSRLPVAGLILKNLARVALPAETRVWTQIRSGPAKGLWANLDPRFEVMYLEADYEAAVQEALALHLKPGGVFYDVGAHAGILSMCGVKLAGPDGAVFAVEADPENARRIEENARRNQLNGLTVICRAAWHSDGHVRFQRASKQSSRNQGSVSAESTGELDGVIEVQAIALDSFARHSRMPTVMKIDVEGAEAEVLKGCDDIFRVAKPVIICEVHGSQPAKDVAHCLAEHGYDWRWLESPPQFPRHLLAWARV